MIMSSIATKKNKFVHYEPNLEVSLSINTTNRHDIMFDVSSDFAIITRSTD